MEVKRKSVAKKVLSHIKEDTKEFKKQLADDRKLKKYLQKEEAGKDMKKQSKKDRMDESLSEKHGKESKKKQSFKDRRDESKGMKHADKKEDVKLIKKMVKKGCR